MNRIKYHDTMNEAFSGRNIFQPIHGPGVLSRNTKRFNLFLYKLEEALKVLLSSHGYHIYFLQNRHQSRKPLNG